MNMESLIAFFHDLRPESVARFPEFYSEDAAFKDPFNEVRGIAAIQHIFSHMFHQVAEPRFRVTEHVDGGAGSAMLVWEFHYRLGLRGKDRVIHGVSHLRFDAAGKVNYHRDYWDAAEELYMKLPVLGCLMRALRRAFAA